MAVALAQQVEFESGSITALSNGSRTGILGSSTATRITVAVGDVLVLWFTSGSTNFVPNTAPPNLTGITWTERYLRVVTGTTPIGCWTATATQAATVTVTLPYRYVSTSGSNAGWLVLERYTGAVEPATAVGTAASSTSAAATVTQSGTNALLSWIVADFAGVVSGTPTAATGNTLGQSYYGPSGVLAAWTGRNGPNATAGTKTVGISSFSTTATRKLMIGAVEVAPKVTAAISTLSSDFTTLPAFLNDNFGTVSIVGGQASLAVTLDYSGIQTLEKYDGQGSSAFVKITPQHPRTGTYETIYYWWIDGDNYVAFYISGATFRGQVRKAGVNTFVTFNGDVYDPVAHAYWRIREAGGTVFFDASPNGATWTNLGNLPHTLDLSAVVFEIATGHYEAETAVPNTLVDNLNIAGTVAYTQAVADTIGVQDPGATASAHPTISSLTSDFATLPPFFDGNFGGVSLVDAQGVVPTVGTYAAFATTGRYSAMSDAVYVRVVTPSGTEGTRQNSLKLEVDTTNSVEMMLDGGVFHGRITRAGVTTNISLNGGAYSPTPHAYWRIREAGGTLYWDTSTNATTWTNLGSAVHTLDLSAVRLLLQAGFYGTETVAPPATVYDNLNSTAPTPISYTQTVTDQAAVVDSATRTVTGGRAVTDTPSVVDSTTAVVVSDRTVTDSAGVTDSAQASKTGDTSTTDAIGVTDAATSVGSYIRTVTDTLGVTDDQTWVGGASRELTDAMDIADVEGLAANQDYRQTPTDAFGVVDEQSSLVGNDLGLGDEFGVADDVSATSEYAPEIADTFAVADPLVRSADYNQQFDETLGVTDSASAVRNTALSAVDAVGVSDAAHAVAEHAATITDVVGTVDDTSRTSPASRGLTEPVGVVDSVDVRGRGRITLAADTAVETDTATELRPTASMPVPVAIETSSAVTPRPTAQANASLATETDTAATPRPTGSYPTATVTERDLAFTPVVLVDDGEFGVAISDADRVPVFRLKADWNRNGLYDHALSDLTSLVTEVSVDRSLTGTLPAEIGLVEGYSTAALSVTLEGKWWGDPEANMDVVDVFAPYRPDSPLYGKPVLRTPIYLDTGFIADDGPRFDRRFTGTVSSINPASGARTVQLGGLDPATQLRETVTIPGSGLYEYMLERYGPDAYRSRINSQWLIDQALRANGIYSSPPHRADAILAVTGHGSFIPDVGWGGAPEEYFPTYRGEMWTPGPFGGAIAPLNGGRGRWWMTDQITAASGDGFGFSMWLGMYPAGQTSGQYFNIELTTNASWFFRFGIDTNGRPYVGAFRSGSSEVRATATGYTPPSSPRWQFVGLHVTFAATSMTARFRINGTTYTATATIASRSGSWQPRTYLRYNFPVAFTNFQMWKGATAPAAPWQGEDVNFVPQADLDPGSNELTGIPELTGIDAKELIQTLVDAEGSTFQFTEDKRPQFRSIKGDQWYGRTKTVKERVTADRNLSDLVSTTDESTIRNTINIKTKTQLISDWQDYYVASDVDAFYTPAGSTSYFELQLPSSAYEIPPSLSTFGCVWTLPNCYTSAGGTGYIYFQTNEDWSEHYDDPAFARYVRTMSVRADDPTVIPGFGVQIRVVRLTPWKMQVIVNNQREFPIRFSTQTRVDANGVITDEGEPSLIIPARIVEEGPGQIETYTDNASVATYGPSSYDVGGSEERWRQSPEGFRGLAMEVLGTTAHPIPVLDAVDVPHDPRRHIGDRIVLEDPDGLGQVIVSIVGLVQTYSSGGAMDRITVRPLAPPGLGLLDDPTQGLLDINLVVGP